MSSGIFSSGEDLGQTVPDRERWYGCHFGDAVPVSPVVDPAFNAMSSFVIDTGRGETSRVVCAAHSLGHHNMAVVPRSIVAMNASLTVAPYPWANQL